jgi:hypothetical protein
VEAVVENPYDAIQKQLRGKMTGMMTDEIAALLAEQDRLRKELADMETVTLFFWQTNLVYNMLRV